MAKKSSPTPARGGPAKKSPAKKSPATPSAILGPHPAKGTLFGDWLKESDEFTRSGIPLRDLSEIAGSRQTATDLLLPMLATHHASDDRLRRITDIRALLKKAGFSAEAEKRTVYPQPLDTKKGNFAEVVLAEYIQASGNLSLPVYRLRHNPNIDQSMKGDDVLALDLSGSRPRIIVGEAKFRNIPGAAVVREIGENLAASYGGGLPASLDFIAERICETGDKELGRQILELSLDLARGRLRRDYVGLLLSSHNAKTNVEKHAEDKGLRSLLLLTIGLNDAEDLVKLCFTQLERQL